MLFFNKRAANRLSIHREGRGVIINQHINTLGQLTHGTEIRHQEVNQSIATLRRWHFVIKSHEAKNKITNTNSIPVTLS